MRLSKLIGEIGAKYDRLLPMSSEAHGLLHQAETEVKQWIPADHLVESNSGKSKPAITPRIAIFNPDETTTTRHGMYVAYLFAADMSTVTLTLNQGVAEMAEHLGRAGARLVRSLEATTIRAGLRPKDIADLDITFDLQTTAASSVDHQHANIVSRTYRLASLPSESKMVADLKRFIRLHALALKAREVALRHGRHEFITQAQLPAAKIEIKKSPEPEPKPPSKPEVKPPAKPEAKPPAKPEAKAEVKPPSKPETKQLAKPEVKPLAKPETKPETKQLAKPETKAEAKPAAKKEPEPDLTKKTSSDGKKSVPEPDTDTDTSKKLPAPEIRLALKNKTLARSMTRRGLLATLVAAPVAFVTPSVAAPKIQAAHAQMPKPVQKTPSFTVDVSQHDWKRREGNLDWASIRRAGVAGMCARATYGDPSGYNWPTHHFGDFARASRNAGMALRGGYHNIVRGDQASINRQVDWLRRELDRHDANWAMLDVERYAELVKAEMWPRWEDVRRFDDRWAEVETRVLVGYIPPWNWSKHLGQPDLREFRGPLIASNYPLEANKDFKQLYDQIGGNDGRGWAVYGNRVPEGWQYSSRAKVPGAAYICDVNAWRLTVDQLTTLLIGKRQPTRRAAQPDL